MEYTIKKGIYVMTIIFFLSLEFSHAQIHNNLNDGKFNTIMFKISSDKNDKISYLFGTHHAFGKAFFDSLPEANKALSASEVLLKENLNVPGQMAQDIINGRKQFTNWKKFVSKDDLEFLENLFATSPTDYNKMTPTEMYVFLNRHFKQQICLSKDVNDTSLSLDDYIASKAVELHKELYGLETTEEQINLLNKDVEGMPQKMHKRRLGNIIEKIKTRNLNDCQETKWYTQMGMDYQVDEPCRNTLLLTDRNHRWMKTISGLIEEKNCFIAVGLSHLMFECGLLNQLKEIGYTVTPMEVR